MTIAQSWAAIEAFFRKHAPGAFTPRPPASAAQIARAESTIGYALPDDYKRSLLIHDGIEDNSELEWFYASWLAPLESCTEAWADFSDYYGEDLDEGLGEDEAFDPILNHPKCFPVLGTSYWDYNIGYLDLIPGPAGKSGQLITLVDECDFALIAGSFEAFLERIAELMKNDELKIHRDDMLHVVAKADGRALGDLLAEAPPGV